MTKEAPKMSVQEVRDNFLARCAAQRKKIQKMSDKQRKEYYAANSKKAKETRLRKTAGLVFPVRKTKKDLQKATSIKCNATTGVYATAVMEYLCAEVLELAGNDANPKGDTHKRIKPKNIMNAIRNDDELNRFVPRTAIMSQAGVVQKQIPSFLSKNNVPRKEWNKDWKSTW